MKNNIEIEQTAFTDTYNVIHGRKRSNAIDYASNAWHPQDYENSSDINDMSIENAISNHDNHLAINILTKATHHSFYKATLFKHAAKHGCLDIVKFMIKDKWDVNDFTIWDKNTPLITAIIYNQPQIAAMLIAFGADIEHKDQLYQTPLMYAVMSCNIEMTKLLIDVGANIFATDINGNNVLQLLKREISHIKSNQENHTPEEKEKVKIYRNLLKYLNTKTKHFHILNNHEDFSGKISKNLKIKLKSAKMSFPENISCIVLSYLDTKSIWLFWGLLNHKKILINHAARSNISRVMGAHTSVSLFAMPAKQKTSKDCVTEEPSKQRDFQFTLSFN